MREIFLHLKKILPSDFWKWLLILVVISILWILELSSIFYGWLDTKLYHTKPFRETYSFFQNFTLINIFIGCSLIALFVYWWKYIRRDKDFLFYRPFLVITLLIFFAYPGYSLIKIYGSFDLRILFLILLAVSLLIMADKFICILSTSFYSSFSYSKTGLVTEGLNNDNNKLSPNLKRFADSIKRRIDSTDCREQSMAIGITSEWGTGKTTVLDYLKIELEKDDRMAIVDFNPWMCPNPQEVISNFFSSLSHQLSARHSTISRPIMKYAKMLGGLRIGPKSNFLIDLIFKSNDKSLFERKVSLSEKLSKLQEKVVILIDDIDRLERGEVFEVLRLIRNTADLKNTLFIVAYDKDYVVKVLEEKNISEASEYLEKIFPIELSLPKAESEDLWSVFIQDMSQQNNLNTPIENYIERSFNKINDGKKIFLKVLRSYRKVRRFSRLLTVQIDHLQNNFTNEISLYDLLWLDLIQIYDKKIYNLLYSNPLNILFIDSAGKYQLRGGILTPAQKNDLNAFHGEPCWKELTPAILHILFNYNNKSIGRQMRSINIPENLNKYYTFSVSSYLVSNVEMNKFLQSQDTGEQIVNKWIKSGKYFSSISHHLESYLFKEKGEKELNARIFEGLLRLGMNTAKYGYIYINKIKSIIALESHFTYKQKKLLEDTFYDFIARMQNSIGEEVNVCRFLNNFYQVQSFDMDGKPEKIQLLLIENEKIKSMLCETIQLYLERNTHMKVSDIFETKTSFSQIFKSCCLLKTYGPDRIYDQYEQIAWDIMICHFADNQNKLDRKDFDEALSKLYEIPVIDEKDFENPWEVEDYLEMQYEQQDDYRASIFGSENIFVEKGSKLYEFREKCFTSKYLPVLSSSVIS